MTRASVGRDAGSMLPILFPKVVSSLCVSFLRIVRAITGAESPSLSSSHQTKRENASALRLKKSFCLYESVRRAGVDQLFERRASAYQIGINGEVAFGEEF